MGNWKAKWETEAGPSGQRFRGDSGLAGLRESGVGKEHELWNGIDMANVQLHSSALGTLENSLNLSVLTCKMEKTPILQLLVRSN